MKQLSRGYALQEGLKIRRLLVEKPQAQIYSSSSDGYVLCLEAELYRRLSSSFPLPREDFIYDDELPGYIYARYGTGLIAFLDEGPFPQRFSQLNNFAEAFRDSKSLEDKYDFQDSIFIEDLRLLLPLQEKKEDSDMLVAFGCFVTAGVKVRADEKQRFLSFASWIPQEGYMLLAEKAGIEVKETKPARESRQKQLEKEDTEPLSIEELREKAPFSLPGRPELEKFFRENIIDIVLNQEAYRNMGIEFPGATVLYGPPGCGKTYAVERLAEYLGWKTFEINSGSIGSSYIHETGKKISQLFGSAIKEAPSIIIIDEMEAFLAQRSGGSENHHMEEMAEFLRMIPKAAQSGVLIFAMTNMLESIDKAVIRKGRFEHMIEIKPVSAVEVLNLMENKLKKLPVEPELELDKIAEKLAGRPISDTVYVIREAGRLAVLNSKDKIDMDCFTSAMNSLGEINNQKRKIGF